MDQQLPSRFRLALALHLHVTKPPMLSLSEYIHLLSHHTTTIPTRHLDAARFWKARAEALEHQVVALQVEAAASAATNTITASTITGGSKELQNVKSGEEQTIKIVLPQPAATTWWARSLHFIRDPAVLSAAVQHLAHEGGGASLPQLVTALSTLPSCAERAAGVAAVVDAMLRLLQGVVNASALAIEGGGEKNGRFWDTQVLVGLVQGWGEYESEVQRQVLESFCEGVLRVVVEVVAVALEGGVRERVLAEEAGWYLLGVLEAVWGPYRKFCGGQYGKRREGVLRRVLKEKVMQRGYRMEVVESLFVAAVVGVVGVDVLFDV